jgi:4-diphosphocytidyl-2-C-methyl-D-erythritol kinase
MVNKVLMNHSLFAAAKINLSLQITGKRDNGYHILNTLIGFTNLGDRITVVPASNYSLTIDGPYKGHAPADESNLVTRAVRLMEAACQRKADIAVTLTKSIPAGAGLGGGSADAAVVMSELNKIWDSPLNITQLQDLGLKLGAELPVCLRAPGVFRVHGIGEGVMRESIPRQTGIIIWPGVALATGDVFKEYKGEKHDQNDLLDAAIRLAPPIAQALETLNTIGCTSTGMSGSGSSVFGMCEGGWEKAAKLAALHPTWWVKSFIINS